MRLGWVALPLLIAVEACSPVRKYQEAARSLRFSLDRVEPSFQLGFPLERSRLSFHLILGVDNPSTVPFHLRGFLGDLRMESLGSSAQVGHLELEKAVDLPAGGHAELAVEASFVYQNLKAQWGPLQSALRAESQGAWALEGELKLEAYGFPWQLPVKTRRPFGTAP